MLARELGMTHRELLRRMSTAEFAEWAALYELEAFDAKQREQKAKLASKTRRR